MIELKIKDDLASYIDTEELQKQAEYEIKNIIRETVSKMCKSDETIQKLIENVVNKKLSEVVFSAEVNELLEKKIIEAIEKKGDWSVGYAVGLDDKISKIYEDNEGELIGILNDKVKSTINNYEVKEYEINNAVSKIVTDFIMKSSDGLDIKEKLEMFVQNGVERIMENLSY
jgi:K+-transporting ATPase c subunit